MKDLAPEIYRQRLIIEGIYTIEIIPEKLEEFMHEFSKRLAMTIIIGPIVKNLAEQINPIHKGYECILVWAESGMSVYTWDLNRFFTIDIYTCKPFEETIAIELAKEFFKADELVHKSV